MDILEAAQKLREAAEKVAEEKNITVQEAWNEALKDFKKIYGLS